MEVSQYFYIFNAHQKNVTMKSINWIQLFFGLALTGLVACTSNADSGDQQNGEDTGKTETPDAPQEDAPTAALSGENFEISVLESGIPSPRKEMKGTIADVEITINYGSPAVKGRTIWGDLVPYDQVWRTGANKATSFTVSKDVMINGQKLAAGTYGLFTIPGEEQWTIIINEDHGQWGSSSYAEDKDVLRVSANPKQLDETKEAMDFMIDGNEVVLQWDKLAIPFTVAPA